LSTIELRPVVCMPSTIPLSGRYPNEFYDLYEGGRYFNYGMSQANEIVS